MYTGIDQGASEALPLASVLLFQGHSKMKINSMETIARKAPILILDLLCFVVCLLRQGLST